MEFDDFIGRLNPHFALGHTSYTYLDCLGLVILWLNDTGYWCDWEAEVTRKITNPVLLKEQLVQHKFVQIDNPPTDRPCVATWAPHKDSGHLGLYDNQRGLVYHMTPWGLRSEKLEVCEFWEYKGN